VNISFKIFTGNISVCNVKKSVTVSFAIHMCMYTYCLSAQLSYSDDLEYVLWYKCDIWTSGLKHLRRLNSSVFNIGKC
jgi:hypothetical protein